MLTRMGCLTPEHAQQQHIQVQIIIIIFLYRR